jgi:hypothetical protein
MVMLGFILGEKKEVGCFHEDLILISIFKVACDCYSRIEKKYKDRIVFLSRIF